MEFEKLLKYCNKTPWKDNTPTYEIQEIAIKYCNSFINDLTKNKTYLRVCGQSGSGKTSQVSSSILQSLKQKNIKPAYIAVRNFATLHPHYETLIKNHDIKHVRELTNGFALKCLAFAIDYLIANDVFILLEITLLGSEFETFIINKLNFANYNCSYHILSVNKKISNGFILKRNQNTTTTNSETLRITYKKTYNYFNRIFPKGLKTIIKKHPTKQVVMWNVFSKKPAFTGLLKNCLKPFKENKRILKKLIYTETQLKTSKTEFYLYYFV